MRARARVWRGSRGGRERRACRAESLAEVRAAEGGGEGSDSRGGGAVWEDSSEAERLSNG